MNLLPDMLDRLSLGLGRIDLRGIGHGQLVHRGSHGLLDLASPLGPDGLSDLLGPLELLGLLGIDVG